MIYFWLLSRERKMFFSRLIRFFLLVALISAASAARIFPVHSARAGGKLYLNSRGTCCQAGGSGGLVFLRGKYIFPAGGSWYHLERMDWEFTASAACRDNSMEQRFEASSQDIMVRKFSRAGGKKKGCKVERFFVLHSNRESIDSWLDSGTYATSLLTENAAGHQLFTDSEVMPVYIGDKIISILEAFNLYAGGAHGMSGYGCRTYTLSGRELKLRDLFSDWSSVEKGLKACFIKNWERNAEKTAREKSGSKEEYKQALKIISSMKPGYEKALNQGLADKSFVLTRSSEGTRLNLYYPPYSFGAYVHGGTWISVLFGNLEQSAGKYMNEWIKKEDSIQPELPGKLRYFDRETEHYGAFPPESISEQMFFAGMAQLADRNKLPAGISRMLPRQSRQKSKN